MKELLRTTDPTVMAFAKVLLNAKLITCFEFDVNSSILEGSIGILPQRLMVADRDYFFAVSVLRDNNVDMVSPWI